MGFEIIFKVSALSMPKYFKHLRYQKSSQWLPWSLNSQPGQARIEYWRFKIEDLWDRSGILVSLFCEPIYIYNLIYILKLRITGQDDGIFSLGRGNRKAISERKCILIQEHRVGRIMCIK